MKQKKNIEIKFYSICYDFKEKHEFDLSYLGETILRNIGMAIYSGNGKKWGGESTFSPTTHNDYDKEFYRKLIKVEPTYKVIDFLDYHFNYFSANTNTKESKELFLLNIQYEILPMLKNVRRHVFFEIAKDWLNNKRSVIEKKQNMIAPKKIRKYLTPAMKKRLQAEVHSICPFCPNSDVETFEFHHIDGDRSNTVYKNLIMVCPTCHAKIEKGLIQKSEVFNKKNNLSMNKKGKIDGIGINNNTLNNSFIGNNNIINFNLKKQDERKVFPKYPVGSIGENVIMYGYSKYLADRYADFRNYDLKLKHQKFNYASFYGKVKKDFKAGGFFHIPQSRFDELVN
ncbi:MAG: HNH endonuclease [Bacteroidales bacterium]